MKIPENANPYCAIVNGVEHVYEAGAETTVAEGVAELINAAGNFPPEAEQAKPPFNGGGMLAVNVTETTTDDGPVYTCDKTAGEMYAAAPAIAFLALEDGYYAVALLGGYGYANGTYNFAMGTGVGALTFTAESADAYPVSGGGPK